MSNTNVASGGRKVFLFLQGAPNSFARRLADELERRGHRALRVNLCAGDLFYWLGRPAINYRGRLRGWETFLRALIADEGVTDILYYADRLPYHQVAIRVATELGVTAVSYEFGYLRPDWITLERGGMSAQSHFPTDPEQIRRIARQVPEPDLTVRYRYTFFMEASNDVFFNLSNLFLFFLYPFYEPDKMYNRLGEYLSYIPRLLMGPRRARQATEVIGRLLDSGREIFVFPLQMQNDYQVRSNSPYRHLREVIHETLHSFSRHAPPSAHLVFKVHPLDNGLENWPRIIARLASVAGVTERVSLIDGGDLVRMLSHARGVVLINSTVGLHALQVGCPVKVLGIATYDIAGLTHQGPLDGFWREPAAPDPHLYRDLVRAMAATIQIKGNFYTRQGQDCAIDEAAHRLIEGRINQPDAFVEPPPRYAQALAMGVPWVLNDAAQTAPAGSR